MLTVLQRTHKKMAVNPKATPKVKRASALPSFAKRKEAEIIARRKARAAAAKKKKNRKIKNRAK